MSATATPLQLRIDLVSDVVCPWCIIGYLQLQKALQPRADRIQLELHWHPFELNPDMPPEGQDLREHVAKKYGSTPEQSRGARARLTELGASLGFEFNYSDDMRMVNTFRAHQLLHWAGEQGVQTGLKLALFDAFFRRGEDVSTTAVLTAVAGRVGLDETEAAAVLADGRYAQAVRQDQRQWLEQGIQAVPTFVINQQYMVQGAQEAAAFGRMLDKLLGERAA
jgi:predicted DsbA family dithiol-disulfide isomerase